jgi:hypothetical protein
MGEARNVTRRTLLGGMAAAGAVSLARPAAGLAEALGPRRPVFSRWIGALSGESAPIRLPAVFALVGIEWKGPAAAAIELRAQSSDGGWSPWVTASVLGHDGDGRAQGGILFGEPVWTDSADGVQLRSDRSINGLRLHLVRARRGGAAPAATAAQSPGSLPQALPVLEAGPGQPPIIARRAWGSGQAPPRHPAEYGTVKLAFVHHTVNPNGYTSAAVPSMLRGIFDYHVYVRGFWDIAYNFLVDAYGRIWEGRAGGIDMAVIGAHAGAYNAESTGVAVLGDFMNVVPPRPAIRALEQLLAWKLSLHGVPAGGRVTVVVDPADYFYTPFAPGAHVSLPRVAGHRDGDSTDCPGNAFYARLPSIRPRVISLAGTPAVLTLAASPAPVLAGAPVTLSGRLALLTGAPLAGAPLELQQLGSGGPREQTIATLSTAQDGSWSTSMSPQQNTSVRVLHRPAPASVADWVGIEVAPAITVTVQSSAPLELSGTISPPKPYVRLELRQPGNLTRKPLISQRVAAAQGSFAAQINASSPGDYVLIARSAADATNAAGASAPVNVTVQ